MNFLAPFGTLVLFFALTLPAYGQSLNFGTHIPYAFKAQNDMSGSSQKFDINPFVSVAGTYRLARSHFFLPELGYIHHTDRADNTSVSTLFLLYNFGFHFAGPVMVRYGLGTFITRISGDGGEVRLGDGEGTSTFYTPDESVRTYYSTANLGLEYRFSSDWAGRFEGHVMGPMSSEKRKFSYTLSASYYW